MLPVPLFTDIIVQKKRRDEEEQNLNINRGALEECCGFLAACL